MTYSKQTIKDLSAAISAVCPIDGITINDPNNKSSWKIFYAPNATQAQQILAREALVNFVV